MSTTPLPTVVVGGGLAGLVSAIVLARRAEKVLLLERDDELGGLLRSYRSDAGYAFDYGTHFALDTGIEALDELLFAALDKDEWTCFSDSLEEAHYFAGQLYRGSGCPDARALAPQDYERGVLDLMSTTPSQGDRSTLGEALVADYGEGFTQSVFAPVIRKICGRDLTELDPMTHHELGLSRLIVFNPQMTRQLKLSPYFDDRIAWTHRQDGHSDIRKFYPRTGGIQSWVEVLVRELRHLGGEIICGNSVADVERSDRMVKTLRLQDGQSIRCGLVVWTLSPIHLARLSGVGNIDSSTRPAFRDVALFHLVYDRSVLLDEHWVTCFDEDLLSYRVTLYPNITNGPRVAPPHHLTVEVLCDVAREPERWLPDIRNELVRMGIVAPDAKVLFETVQVLPRALPIIPPGAKTAAERVAKDIQSGLDNVLLVGQGAGHHKMIPMLKHLWSSLNDTDN